MAYANNRDCFVFIHCLALCLAVLLFKFRNNNDDNDHKIEGEKETESETMQTNGGQRDLRISPKSMTSDEEHSTAHSM